MQLLEIGIAKHQPIVGVPQHEGFRNGLDGVAQAQIGGHRLLHQVLLLGDVDGDADQMRPRLARLAHQLATRAQPHPMAAGVAHAERVVEECHLGIDEFGGELIKLHIVGMHEAAHVAERHEIVLALQPEDLEHRLRPEDTPAREVPVPQPAAAAVERRVDPAAHGFVDHVGFARARRLPVEGEAEDQHHEAGGGRKRDRQHGERAPGCQRRAARLHDRDLAEGRIEHAHGRQRAGLVGQGDFHDAGAGAEGGQRLRRTEQVDQAAADGGVGAGRGGRHHALGIGQEEAPAGARRPRRQRAGQDFLRPFKRVGGLLERLLKPFDRQIGDRVERNHCAVECLPAMVERLHQGADADGAEKSDDQHRDGAAQQRLGGQQPPIRRLGDRLREAFDGIVTCRRTRHSGARH